MNRTTLVVILGLLLSGTIGAKSLRMLEQAPVSPIATQGNSDDPWADSDSMGVAERAVIDVRLDDESDQLAFIETRIRWHRQQATLLKGGYYNARVTR